MEILIVIAVVLFVPILLLIVQFNSLVSLRNYIRDAWANIDTELKRRYDLIPNLVATVKGYAAHERQVLERVIELRNQRLANTGSSAAQQVQEQELVENLKQVLVDLRKPEQQLMNELRADTRYEVRRGLARDALHCELYAAPEATMLSRFSEFHRAFASSKGNVGLFPSNMVANLFGFRPEEYFNVEPAIRETVPKADFSPP